jgi:hypothetical protein
MKVKVVVNEDWVSPGETLVIENARIAEIAFVPQPYLSEDGVPARIVLCHPDDEVSVREAITESDFMVLADA